MSLDKASLASHRHTRTGLLALGVLLAMPALVPGADQAERKPAPVPRAGTGPAGTARTMKSYGKLPLAFEANQGQTDARVRFLSRGPGYTLFLKSREAVLALRNKQSTVEGEKSGDAKLETGNSKLVTGHSSLVTGPPAVLRMKLLGANPQASSTGLEELPGKSNYFIGNDPKKWRTNVPNYAKVKYENVYPGVDLIYYGGQSERSEGPGGPGRQLEYDFVVHPGANPNAIRFEIVGEGSALSRAARGRPYIAANGDLVIQTDAGEIRFRKPVVYQPVAALYERRAGLVPVTGLKVGAMK